MFGGKERKKEQRKLGNYQRDMSILTQEPQCYQVLEEQQRTKELSLSLPDSFFQNENSSEWSKTSTSKINDNQLVVANLSPEYILVPATPKDDNDTAPPSPLLGKPNSTKRKQCVSPYQETMNSPKRDQQIWEDSSQPHNSDSYEQQIPQVICVLPKLATYYSCGNCVTESCLCKISNIDRECKKLNKRKSISDSNRAEPDQLHKTLTGRSAPRTLTVATLDNEIFPFGVGDSVDFYCTESKHWIPAVISESNQRQRQTAEKPLLFLITPRSEQYQEVWVRPTSELLAR